MWLSLCSTHLTHTHTLSLIHAFPAMQFTYVFRGLLKMFPSSLTTPTPILFADPSIPSTTRFPSIISTLERVISIVNPQEKSNQLKLFFVSTTRDNLYACEYAGDIYSSTVCRCFCCSISS